MGEVSEISWTHATFNPWIGCTKVSPACDHCYAERGAARLGAQHGLKLWDGDRHYTGVDYWKQPHRWNRAAEKAGERRRVFCASFADVFEDRKGLNVPRARLFQIIEETPWLDWLLLTKRPENMAAMAPRAWAKAWPANVWAGTTAENDEWAEKRVPYLLEVPARVRFLNAEPLLGPIHCWAYLAGPIREQALAALGARPLPGLDWIIVGGESGPGARPMHPQWVRDLRKDCITLGVPFHFKQWGEWGPRRQMRPDVPCPHNDGWGALEIDGSFCPTATCWNGHDDDSKNAGAMMYRVGKKVSGRLLDGREWNEFPVPRKSRTSQ